MDDKMTDKPKVFCKDCKWLDASESATLMSYVSCQFNDKYYKCTKPFCDCVTGQPYSSDAWRKPEFFNANCDCPDHTPKDGDL